MINQNNIKSIGHFETTFFKAKHQVDDPSLDLAVHNCTYICRQIYIKARLLSISVTRFSLKWALLPWNVEIAENYLLGILCPIFAASEYSL